MHHVLVVQDVILSDLLRLVLDGRSPDQRVLELLDDGPVELVAEVLHGALFRLQDNRGLVVGQLALGLRVDANLLRKKSKILQNSICFCFLYHPPTSLR